MLTVFDKNDPLFQSDSTFAKEEVVYNLIHRIVETENAVCVSSEDRQMVFAQTPDHNGWLWIAEDVEKADRKKLIVNLLDYLGDRNVPGVTAVPETAEQFAKNYAAAKGKNWTEYMTMESYFCPSVKIENVTAGSLMPASKDHLEKTALFLAEFVEEAFGNRTEPKSQIASAEKLISAGNVYLWEVKGEIVSMANIAHRSQRHARINGVYTPVSLRKKGYASAVVAGVSSLLHNEGLTPMLYADLKNPSANKIYQKIGYVECGKIADVRFSEV
jgi:predicted GNAT family acetyltransferase